MTDPWESPLLDRLMGWVLGGAVVALGLLALSVLAWGAIELFKSPVAPTTSDPSGVWAGLVDDLPSGRLVECVFARDPSGSVAVTCDWQNAVRRP